MSNSFFGGYLVLIRSPTKNPLTFDRICQIVVFSPQKCAIVTKLWVNAPHKKPLFTKQKIEQKSP